MGIDKNTKETNKLKKTTKAEIGKSLTTYREATDIYAIKGMYDMLVFIQENWQDLTNTE